MVIACPDCAARLTVADALAEKTERKVLCPGCKRVFSMKDGVKAAPAPPPQAPPVPVRQVPAAPPPQVPAAPPPQIPAAPPPQAPPAPPPRALPPPGLDPLATRRMSSKEVADVRSSFTLEEAMAGALPPEPGRPPDGFEVHRPDYQGTTFSLDELKDLVKRGWLDRTDGIRKPGTALWTGAADHPELARAFTLRSKLDAQKLSTVAAKAPLACANHPKKKAAYRCDGCSRAFCGECGNESELKQQPVLLCIECDVPMKALGG